MPNPNAQERAEKISREYCALPTNSLGQNITHKEHVRLIASELEAYAEERVKEALRNLK